MMRSCLRFSIIGGGGFGQEVASYIYEIHKNSAHKITFWDDNNDLNFINIPDLKFGGKLDKISVDSSETVLICIGNCKKRSKIANLLLDRGITLGRFIHPSAIVSSFARIEPGCIILPLSCISAGAVIGENTAINSHVAVGHHAVIGKNCVISPQCLIAGNVKIGAETFLGANTVIAPGKVIGEKSKISAGGVVYRNAGPRSFLFGNPAKNFSKG